jgi:hypothetical protein
MFWRFGLAVLVLSAGTGAVRPAAVAPGPSVSMGADGRLVYTPDERGNRIIDFSSAGYASGSEPVPEAAERARVEPGDGDDGARIQSAIDRISALPRDATGLRGAVVLAAGSFEVGGTIRIRSSGVVLRGAGPGDTGTVVVATGLSRRPLVEIAGSGNRRALGPPRDITTRLVPVGAAEFDVADAAGFSVGDRILVQRPSTASWIDALGMNRFQGWRPENRLHWQPGSRDIAWDRVVTRIDGTRLELDAPITTSIDRSDAAGSVTRYEFPGRIVNVGVEHLRLISQFDASRPKDEDHAWIGVTLDKVEDAWVRRVAAIHFAGSAVDVQRDARRVTVEDVEARDPVSEIGGYRRRAFYTEGQLGLFQRLRSRGAQHDFAMGFLATGPNVFRDSESESSLDFSGALESWASGTLFDNVRIRGGALRLGDRDAANQGAGWAAANSVLWNCEATDVEAVSPPGAYNRAFGCRGVASGDGIVDDARAVPFRDFFRGIPVEPPSLYRAQRAERLATRSPTSVPPPPSLVADPAPAGAGAARPSPTSVLLGRAATPPSPSVHLRPSPLRVERGRFFIGDLAAWTHRTNYAWFQAQMAPALAPSFGPAITRFAPGRIGQGLTDDLEQVVQSMPPGGVFYQHYGLWYDRRRVNHNYDGSAERADGNVWAPFMELPWARSGQGKAWDGLSRYDLTRFNPWYFARLKEFADLCDREGRVLYYNFYFQHWLLESRSHYVDFPWRPVNAIQDTGMPDEVPAANAFWDLSHPLRRDLHRRYIRHVLDTLGHHTNVVFGIDREYTGSLGFLRFWLDEIGAWQKASGRRLLVALEVPKDQMDSILADPVRARLVAAVDFHGWVYRPDGKLFAIRGGLNRSPREQRSDIATPDEREALRAALDPAMAANPDYQNGPEFQKLFDRLWASTPALRERARREYRDRYPNLVVLSEEPAK